MSKSLHFLERLLNALPSDIHKVAIVRGKDTNDGDVYELVGAGTNWTDEITMPIGCQMYEALSEYLPFIGSAIITESVSVHDLNIQYRKCSVTALMLDKTL